MGYPPGGRGAPRYLPSPTSRFWNIAMGRPPKISIDLSLRTGYFFSGPKLLPDSRLSWKAWSVGEEILSPTQSFLVELLSCVCGAVSAE